MAVPSEYVYRDGWYFDIASGAGPFSFDGTSMWLAGIGSVQTELDQPSGGWAVRQNTGFLSSKCYWRRASDVGPAPGALMCRTSTMTEWGFPALTCVGSVIGSDASPAETLTVAGTTAFSNSSRILLPADLLKEAKMFEIVGNIKHNGNGSGSGSCTVTIHLGTAGTAADAGLVVKTSVSANETWSTFCRGFILSSTKVAVQPSQNGINASTLVEHTTNVNTAAAMYVSLGVSAATAGHTAEVHQLMVYVR